VAQAKILGPAELAQLERQETRSPETQLDIEKTQAAEFLALAEVTPEDVAFCTQYRSAILQLEMLLHGQALALHRDLDNLTRQTQWGKGFLPFDQSFYELKRFVRDRLGLDAFLNPDVSWSDADLQPLADRVRRHRQQVQQILHFSVPEDPRIASNGWIFQMLCQQLGLKVQSQRRGPRGKQVRYFRLQRAHFEQVMAVIQRRQQRRSPDVAMAPETRPDATIPAPSPEIADFPAPARMPIPEELAVVTPTGLNQTEGGDYAITPPGKTANKVTKLLPSDWQPYLVDRLRRQLDQVVAGLRLVWDGTISGGSDFGHDRRSIWPPGSLGVT
jgi:hypothetical protein